MLNPRALDGVDSLVVLTAADRDALAAHLEEIRFAPGEILIHEGRRSPGAFLLLDGELRVDKAIPGQPGAAISSPIPAGEWFGMVSLLDGLGATATVRAVTPVTVAAMGRADFWGLVGSGTPLGVRFLRAMLRCHALQLQRLNAGLLRLRRELGRAPAG